MLLTCSPVPHCRFIFPLLLILLGMAGCVSGTYSDKSGDKSQSSPATKNMNQPDPVLLKGPYLMNAKKDQITIAWETEEKSHSLVEVSGPGFTTRTFRNIPYSMTTRNGQDFIPPIPPGGFQHRVTVTGLKAGTSYYYRLMSLAKPSPKFSFRTAPMPGQPFVFAAYGDSRSNKAVHRRVIAGLTKHHPHLVLHSGDLVMSGFNLLNWQSFFNEAQEMLQKSVFLPAFGNHENGGKSLFAGYFSAIYNTEEKPFGFSQYRYGDMLVVVVNSEMSLKTGKPMRVLLEKALRKSQTDKTIQYRLVMFHRPLFTWGKHKPKRIYDNHTKTSLQNLMKTMKVQAVLAGHNHCYERFLVDGVTYLTLGGGGAPLYDANQNRIESEKRYRKKSAERHHYAIVRTTGTRMDWTVYDSELNQEIDTFFLSPK